MGRVVNVPSVESWQFVIALYWLYAVVAFAEEVRPGIRFGWGSRAENTNPNTEGGI